MQGRSNGKPGAGGRVEQSAVAAAWIENDVSRRPDGKCCQQPSHHTRRVVLTVPVTVIAIVSCHRGYHCRAGAEGVGRAATEAFVASFIVILILDFFLAMFLNDLSARFFPSTGKLL